MFPLLCNTSPEPSRSPKRYYPVRHHKSDAPGAVGAGSAAHVLLHLLVHSSVWDTCWSVRQLLGDPMTRSWVRDHPWKQMRRPASSRTVEPPRAWAAELRAVRACPCSSPTVVSEIPGTFRRICPNIIVWIFCVCFRRKQILIDLWEKLEHSVSMQVSGSSEEFLSVGLFLMG